MYSVISLLIVLVVSIVVVRVATVALTLTGLSEQLARFQARSAFTGSGFTTTESEKVVQHPVRRRIIMLLMLLGNAGIVTAVASLMLSFINRSPGEGVTEAAWFRILMLVLGFSALLTFAHSRWIDKRMSQLISWALKRWTSIEVHDYAGLLHMTGEYIVAEMAVGADDWLAGRTLKELNLSDEGVVVLGIERNNGAYLGAPRGDAAAQAGDTLLLYGRKKSIAELDERRRGPRGNWEHVAAVEQQKQVEAEEVADEASRGPSH